MARAPISGTVVEFTVAIGHDDLLVREGDCGLAHAVSLLSSRTGIDAGALPVGDVDVLIAELRRAAIGDGLVAEGACGACGAPVDVDFSLAALMEHARPRATRLAVADSDGWWALRGGATRFRIPTAADVLASGSVEALAARCIVGGDVARVERTLAALAPTLRTTGIGGCPECGAEVAVDVDARTLCLEELRFLAGAVLEDVHLLASAYGWTEDTILALPSPRRHEYAELIRAGRTAATAASLEFADA